MTEAEICPKCSTAFSAREALVSSGLHLTTNVFTDRDIVMKVRCPNCWHVFPARELRFFGFLSPNGLRWAAIAFLVICVVLAVAGR